MTILFFGDIVGKAGRSALRQVLPKLKKKYKPDLIIVNGENAAHGVGITRRTSQALFDLGIDVITGGNHIFKKPEAEELLSEENSKIIRPANYPESAPGKGYLITEVKGEKVLIANLMGRVFLNEDFECPFRALEKILAENPEIKNIIVDLHAEATSEKRAFGLYFDGKISACVGTHTHVLTADAQILPKGTAYISDLGMAGVKDSIIGMNKEQIFQRFLTQMPIKFEVVEEGLCEIGGVMIEIDEKTRKAKKIEIISEEVEA